MGKINSRGKQKNFSGKIRFNILTAIVYIVGIVLLAQLFNLQIINGEEYRENSNTKLTRESTLIADRGQIKDSSGEKLASSVTQYTVELYKTKIDDDTLNTSILNLVTLLSANGDTYVDNFLVNIDPFEFKLDTEEKQKKWKKANNIDENATAEEVFYYFKNKYKIKTDNIEDARKIMAIRYEISFNGYSSTRSITIAKNISSASFNLISEQNSFFPGVTISESSTREYPLRNTASHIVGRIGRITEEELKNVDERYGMNDIIGKSGIEYVFEKYLKGTNGTEQIDMNVDGTITGEYISKEAVAGSDVILTIDSKLQEITEEALKNNIDKIADGGFSKRYDADAGAAIVLNIKTGEVLAMASYPDYDPSDFINGIDTDTWNYYINGDTKPLENKAIAAQYSPGSTFKMATAITGLEEGAISPYEKINDTGVYPHAHNPVCWYYTSYHRGHGWLDVSQAIQHSCNFFFYEVGRRVGIDNLSKYSLYLGLGKKTGIELDGEITGSLASRQRAVDENRDWYLGETLSAAIGQSYNAFTPLQMAKYVAMIANGGHNIDITVVKSIINADGSEVPKEEYEEYVNQKLGIKTDDEEEMSFDSSNVRAILEGMKDVTSESGGTAYNTFKDFNITVGGKTGSAQTGIAGKTNAWFVGFAPYDNPEIGIVIFVRNGGSGGYTAETARDIIAQYFGMNTIEITEDTRAHPMIEMRN